MEVRELGKIEEEVCELGRSKEMVCEIRGLRQLRGAGCRYAVNGVIGLLMIRLAFYFLSDVVVDISKLTVSSSVTGNTAKRAGVTSTLSFRSLFIPILETL